MQTTIRQFERAPHLVERTVDKRIGLVILATDHTTEPDFAALVANERIGIYYDCVNKLPGFPAAARTPLKAGK